MGKRLFILTVLGFALLTAPTFAENPSFCQNSFEPAEVMALKVVKVAETETTPKIPEQVWVTAYSSTPEETDESPFITASQTEVRDGIVAVNFLPFGTKIRIPKVFGDKIFIVEDRMHRRKTNYVDVWMNSKDSAKEFGIVKASIEIVEFPS